MTTNTTTDEWFRKAMGADDKKIEIPIPDAEPTENSTKPVSSGGVYAALAGKQPLLTYDETPIKNSANHITSGTVYTALQSISESVSTGGYTGTDKPIYVIRIDPTEDDPAACITYAGANENFTPATKTNLNSWGDTFIGQKIKPCTVQNGAINYWLDPENIFNKADGTAATLTGADGDCMVAIPTVYWKSSIRALKWITTTTQQTVIEIAFSEGQFIGSTPFAHRFGDENTIMPYVFVGMFNGYTSGGVLHSWYSTTSKPTVSQTNDTFQAQAAAGGTGYSVETWNTYTLINLIYLAAYANTNAQATIGQGFVASNNTASAAIGLTYRAQPGGGAYGTTSETTCTRLFYMENRWGNVWNFLQGIMQDASNKIRINHVNTRFITQNVATPAFTDADWTTASGQATTSDSYIRTFVGTDPMPFMPAVVGGSSSTYATDNYWRSTGLRTCVVGGRWLDGAMCGVFAVALFYAPSRSDVSFGARLQILSTGEAASAA